ncbi:serum amyloid P-component-like [Leptodactylus fuscus]|uniref:serum amyloid P-component-like n=1 Tax=Leptodactylus fuscus TaxID=238119 RepID=UPI003F4F2133
MPLWLMLWIAPVFGQKNMREKLFAFPVKSSTSYVRISPDHNGPFREASVCMRFHSDLTWGYSLFSWSTKTNVNSFLIYYYPGSGNQFYQEVYGYNHRYYLQDNITEWTSMCVTWDSSVWGLFIDGKYYKVNMKTDVEISGDPIVIIGQWQISHGGGFYASWSFAGEMTDVNMWDKALTDENMMDYFADNEMSGNVINWKALNYTLHGDVTIKPYVDPYPCVHVVL